jgi:hypothetical protein
MRSSIPQRAARGLAAALLLAEGCVFLPPPTVDLHSIELAGEFGPTPFPEPAGTLRVVTDTHDYAYGEHALYSIHEGYDIYDEHGTLLERVENHRTPTDESVTDVRLKAGKYLVAVPDGPKPDFWIAVTIADGRLTEVDVTGLRLPAANHG